MADKISTIINCTNIAPLVDLNKTIESTSLNLGVFAGNGSGKTFLSRMFRLLELNAEIRQEDTDVLLTLGQTTGSFKFKIVTKTGVTIEDVNLRIQKGCVPTISTTHFIYHTFNQDYVDDNIRALNFEKESTIEGFILGKSHIDLSEDESKLKALVGVESQLMSEIESSIHTSLERINGIKDIKRLNEYKSLLNYNTLIKEGESLRSASCPNLRACIDDYDKLKSIPEDLSLIPTISSFQFDLSVLTQIKIELGTEFSLSSFSEEFKNKIKSKQPFVELGLALFQIDTATCPFCGTSTSREMLELIDKYTRFLEDSESQTIRRFQHYERTLVNLKTQYEEVCHETLRISRLFDEYKTKYIPFYKEKQLREFTSINIVSSVDILIDLLQEKTKNISRKIDFPDELEAALYEGIGRIQQLREENNSLVEKLNNSIRKSADELRKVKRYICQSMYNKLLDENSIRLSQLTKLRIDYKELDERIEKKRETIRISKKKKVAETIKLVLDYFFSGKYTLDEESFLLKFNAQSLEKGRVRHVLSEGEKSIIAFAYYLGDAHMKMEREDDYDRLFFVIDDPISSMDFTYVYTVSGVIRDIKKIIPEISRHSRILVLTHNNDFMRILTSNNILDKVVLLKNGQMHDFTDNYSVPYISHLIDIYRIARKGGAATHTTANSIRHIIETLDKFESIKTDENSVKTYIANNFPNDKKSYTYINDLSHGGWRTEQGPMDEDDYREICEMVIKHIEEKFPRQIEFCATLV